MNDEFVETQAGYLARRAKSESQAPIQRMFQITLGHPASPERLQQAEAFVAAHPDGLRDLAHVLFNSSEFVYIQ
jgi:hypothetical protein